MNHKSMRDVNKQILKYVSSKEIDCIQDLILIKLGRCFGPHLAQGWVFWSSNQEMMPKYKYQNSPKILYGIGQK